jgi:GT2 family glycosyltransferase
MREDQDTEVIHYPGPFDFSSMCNAGAARADSDVLVFLNNDTEVLSADWLDRLKSWALKPNIGAVGAKLTYPNGLMQHIGVVVGMGGSAGHFSSLAHADASTWANHHLFVHEVSAVTGACLAVERRKFNAVGGFDAANFPIELNDIDLCLRLAERGWTAIVDPAVHLMHEESTTRGRATFRRLNVYEDQRNRFINRWRHVLRDDPHFHPALSLFHWRAALG